MAITLQYAQALLTTRTYVTSTHFYTLLRAVFNLLKTEHYVSHCDLLKTIIFHKSLQLVAESVLQKLNLSRSCMFLVIHYFPPLDWCVT